MFTEKKFKFKHFNNKAGCCACGVNIEFEAIIQNIDTNLYYIIGSECIKWWDCEKDISNIKLITKAL